MQFFYDIIQCRKIMALCIEPLGVCKKENKIVKIVIIFLTNISNSYFSHGPFLPTPRQTIVNNTIKMMRPPITNLQFIFNH